MSLEERLNATIPTIPDFPKQGINFKDITPMLLDPQLMKDSMDKFAEMLAPLNVEGILGIEARGFIFGTALALRMNIPFLMCRKPFKLPGEKIEYTYQKEYGTDTLQMSKSAIRPGMRIAVIDDLLATGGTALAAIELVKLGGGVPVAAAFVIELGEFNVRNKFKEHGCEVTSLLVV